METVSNIVTKKIITVRADDKISHAAEIMRRNNIRHLPVKDDFNRWVGILSDRDVLRAVKPVDVNEDESTFEYDENHLVRYFMSWPIRSVGMTDSVEYIANLMINEKISCFLVVDILSMEPQGIITSEDMMKYLLKQTEGPKKLKEPIKDMFDSLDMPVYD